MLATCTYPLRFCPRNDVTCLNSIEKLQEFFILAKGVSHSCVISCYRCKGGEECAVNTQQIHLLSTHYLFTLQALKAACFHLEKQKRSFILPTQSTFFYHLLCSLINLSLSSAAQPFSLSPIPSFSFPLLGKKGASPAAFKRCFSHGLSCRLLHLLCPSVAMPTASGLFSFGVFSLCFCRVKRKAENHQTGCF